MERQEREEGRKKLGERTKGRRRGRREGRIGVFVCVVGRKKYAGGNDHLA